MFGSVFVIVFHTARVSINFVLNKFFFLKKKNNKKKKDLNTDHKKQMHFKVYGPNDFKCRSFELACEEIAKLKDATLETIVISSAELRQLFGVNFLVPRVVVDDTLIGGYVDLLGFLKSQSSAPSTPIAKC